MDVYGSALRDFYKNKLSEILWLHNSYGEPEEMPVEEFFRNEADMPDIELAALTCCTGQVLDIGAGAGSHSLILQQRGIAVTALEHSALACTIMRERGVKTIIEQDIFNYGDKRFNTLLLLMNGIGLCGTLSGLELFLDHASNLLLHDGQLIFDSSDISYLYEDIAKPKDRYYGELSYCYEYKGQMGDWFNWLYIDPETLAAISKRKGWQCQILDYNENDHYLARLKKLTVES
ncbi:class I SAM-dependent methyltransferase [Pedobacter sp. BS3]|nr:class I SAM-dependent methyltransferase [Pedobacter sp. BS3]